MARQLARVARALGGRGRGRGLYSFVVLVLTAILLSCSDTKDVPMAVTSVVQAAPSATPTPVTSRTPLVATLVPPPVTVAVSETALPVARPDLSSLQTALDRRLESFDGWASYYVRDLSSGQIITRDGDVPISGTSMVKVPILVETYRALSDFPAVAETRLITETATLSGNYTANLLLELIAGSRDPFAGAVQVTLSMRRLGLYNTFIAVPYDLEPDPRYLSTYATPANQNPGYNTSPDSSMQTSVADMGRLLSLIFDCSQGRGYLLDVYRETLTEAECAEVIAVMRDNDIDAFIEAGVPDGVGVAHKHGWVGDTHGDAAIVDVGESPYVLVVALHRSGWLEWAESTEIIAALSRLTYTHFSEPGNATGSLLAGPLPTPAPTPVLPSATIEGTGGVGVVLRERPGGAEVMIVPEGSLVFLPEDVPVQEGGRTWRKVRLLDDAGGWVVADYLNLH